MSSDINASPSPLAGEDWDEGAVAALNAVDDFAIRVTNLSKCYQIYDKPQHRLLQELFRGRKRFYREFWALKNVSFEVKRGETVGIIGRNGSGKSTLLQMIAGTLTPTSGEIEAKGRVAALLELGSGFNPEFTGRENVYLNASILGLSNEETDVKFDDIAAFADIGDFVDQPVKTYSSGMYVRLAFAVAVHTSPDIMIIDEALAVGDMPFQTKCFSRMNELRASGTTILFVSHDIGTIESFCERALYLRRGEQAAFGPVAEVTRQYQMECMNSQLNTAQQRYHGSTQLNSLKDPTINTAPDEATRLLPALLSIREDYQRHAALSRAGTKTVTIESFRLVRDDESPAEFIQPTEVIRGCFLLTFNRDFEGQIHVGIDIKDKCGTAYMTVRDSSYEQSIKVSAGGKVVAIMRFSLPLKAGEYYCQVGVLLFRDGEKFKSGMFNFADAEIADLVEYGSYFSVTTPRYPIHVPVLNESRVVLTQLADSLCDSGA
jgi:homopolymeric O-antigen transport system ATP-binding protein